MIIIDIIGSIDDKIENNEKITNKILDNLVLTYKILQQNTDTLKFKDVFTLANGFAFKSNKYISNGTHKVITIKNVKENGFNTLSAEKIEYDDAYKNAVLKISDILLTMTGDVGRIGIVDEENCLLNQRVLKVHSYSLAYTYCYLKDNFQIINSLAKGSVQKNLSVTDLNQINVLHSIDTIQEFKKYDYLIESYICINQENKKLNELKQLYLKKFFG